VEETEMYTVSVQYIHYALSTLACVGFGQGMQ
jgi:hypothetical protein